MEQLKLENQVVGHNTGKKNAVVNRKNRKGSTLSKADQNRLRDII